MIPRWRGWLLAGLQLALVASLALKYEVDRRTLPRVWVRAVPYDPDLPIRGRYVSIQVEARVDGELLPKDGEGPRHQFMASPARLVVEDDQLIVRRRAQGDDIWLSEFVPVPSAPSDSPRFRLQAPLAYFIPEHVADPSLRPEGEELWVEVSVPRHGPPRPIRLGVKKGGELTPLDLR